MKKFLLLLLSGMIPWLSFANDALELPKGVLRFSETTSFGFAVSEFNLDGNKVSIAVNDGRLLVFSLGAAVELGVTDWLSAAVRWTPGWNVWSAYDFQTSPSDKLTVNGPYDILVEARAQILGQQGLLRSQRLRLALSPVGKIPLPSPDWEKQISRRSAGQTWVQVPNDHHTPGLGGRAYCDLVLNERFYLDLYAEFLRYFPKKYSEAELLAYLTPTYQKVDYGYDLTIEMEPHLQILAGQGIRFEAGVPLTYQKTPELRFDGAAVADSDTYLLVVSPGLSLFLSKPALELKLAYAYPILGKGLDAPAMNSFSLQVRSYLRLFK